MSTNAACRPDQLWAAFDFPRHPLAREDGERLRGAFYAPPSRWLRALSAAELPAVIDAAHAAARAGAWVLGGLRYEAAAALDACLAVHASEDALAEFAVYESAPQPWPQPAPPQRLCGDWQDPQDDVAACAAVERIREWIRAGDCYQVNLTTRLQAELAAGADLAELFLALHAAQPGGFSLFLREAGLASVSPELFFDWRPLAGTQNTWLLGAQPMKGTAARGRDAAEDEAAQAYLRTSAKERAENLMIVDLLRNDLGRVAQLGSVRVPRLFELHALPTVWQMTSTVTAVSRPGLSLSALLTALFPCGSVTGAPKVRAMQIIRALEPAARGWYCGAAGLLQPGGAVTLNVPIRTVERCHDRGADAVPTRLQCGIGSGITLDSEPAAEVAEWRAKTRFLLRAQAPIAALETLKLSAGQYPLEALHLARLQRCAKHFGLRLPLALVRDRLLALAAAHPQGDWRVRLSCSASGQIDTWVEALEPTPQPVALALADAPIDSEGPGAEFLQHKTSRREAYEALNARKPAGIFDLILYNRHQELSECSFGNLALRIEGRWLTPRREAGGLPGVYRELLLQQGRIHEARLLRSDLDRAEALAFFNSLRGWCDAHLVRPA